MTQNRIIPVKRTVIRLSEDGQEMLLDPRFDRADIFPWLGYGILRIATDEGLSHTHVDQETAVEVHKFSGIPLVTFDHMYEADYDKYLEVQQRLVDDSWLK